MYIEYGQNEKLAAARRLSESPARRPNIAEGTQSVPRAECIYTAGRVQSAAMSQPDTARVAYPVFDGALCGAHPDGLVSDQSHAQNGGRLLGQQQTGVGLTQIGDQQAPVPAARVHSAKVRTHLISTDTHRV